MNDTIKILENLPQLKITCPSCEKTFSAKSANLFNIKDTKRPRKLIKIINEREHSLKRKLKKIEKESQVYVEKINKINTKELELKKRKLSKPIRTEIITRSVNIGQITEKLLPSSNKFGYKTNDCVAIFKPIDYLSFNGLSKNDISSISFIEVKTGNAQLSSAQKKIKNLVEAGNVSLKLYKNGDK